ncbi:MAG: hypothetical protein Q4P25_05775, partial [Tissierellia bacterium]|nr:hypothetical protein [Tissierellia bacterium]
MNIKDLKRIYLQNDELKEIRCFSNIIWWRQPRKVWLCENGDASGYPIDIDPKGNVYQGMSRGYYRKLNSQGQEVWRKQDGGTTFQSIKIDTAGHILICGTYGRLIKLDSSGKKLDEIPKIESFSTSSAYRIIIDDNDNIYLLGGGGLQRGIIAKVSPSFKIQWEKKIPSEGSIYGAANKNNKIYFGTRSGKVCECDSNGNIIELLQLQNKNHIISMVYHDEYLYVGDNGRSLFKIDDNNKIEWEYKDVYTVRQLAVGTTGCVYIGNGFEETVDGFLTKISPNGKLMERLPLI